MIQMDLKSTENSAEKHNRGQTERDGMKFIAAIGFDINSRSLDKVSGDCNLLTMITQVNANQRSVHYENGLYETI